MIRVPVVSCRSQDRLRTTAQVHLGCVGGSALDLRRFQNRSSFLAWLSGAGCVPTLVAQRILAAPVSVSPGRLTGPCARKLYFDAFF